MRTTTLSPLASFTWSLAIGLLLTLGTAGCGGGSMLSSGPELQLIPLQQVDEAPEIVGGYAMVDSLKQYPQAAQEANAKGIVRVQCTITPRGRASRIRIVSRAHNTLRSESIRVVNNLEFRPGRSSGGPVPVDVEIPIRFP